MNKLFFFGIILFFWSCSSENKKETVLEEKSVDAHPINEDSIRQLELEEKTVNLVDTIKEVVLYGDLLMSTTKINPPTLTIWIAATPDETQINYYWLKVGEDNGTNIVTQFNFYVDPVREQVLYYDVVNDTLLTLEDWRKK